jgi:hypothetical protein
VPPVEPVVHARLNGIKPLSGSGLYRKNKTGRNVAGQAQEMRGVCTRGAKIKREGMKLILSTRPLLNAHIERWSKRVMEALGRRGGERVGDVFVEEYLRELWERSRTSS